jgi:hypothetical protein
MDLLLLIKIVPTIVGVVGIGRIIYELISGVKTKLREEYKFAKEFLDQEDISKLHPFTQEKGFQAIAGSTHVTQKEIEYILSLSNPVQRLNDFKKSRLLFEKIETKGDFELIYRKRYASTFSRNWRKGWYLSWYGLLAFCAASPFVFTDKFGQHGLFALLITLPSFGFYAVISLNAYGKLKAAERLTKNKEFHTSNILLETH